MGYGKKLRDRVSYHHKKPCTDKLHKRDGTIFKDDEEHAHIFGYHSRNVFSRQDIIFDVSIFDSIKTRTISN